MRRKKKNLIYTYIILLICSLIPFISLGLPMLKYSYKFYSLRVSGYNAITLLCPWILYVKNLDRAQQGWLVSSLQRLGSQPERRESLRYLNSWRLKLQMKQQMKLSHRTSVELLPGTSTCHFIKWSSWMSLFGFPYCMAARWQEQLWKRAKQKCVAF